MNLHILLPHTSQPKNVRDLYNIDILKESSYFNQFRHTLDEKFQELFNPYDEDINEGYKLRI